MERLLLNAACGLVSVVMTYVISLNNAPEGTQFNSTVPHLNELTVQAQDIRAISVALTFRKN